MGFLDIIRPKAAVQEKIIFTQKSRITNLEKDISDMKALVRLRESELKDVRTNFERGKERLVDQIIELSDKFAEISDMVAKVHSENGRLRSVVDSRRPLLENKSQKKRA